MNKNFVNGLNRICRQSLKNSSLRDLFYKSKQSTINKTILIGLLRFFAKGTPTATNPRNDGLSEYCKIFLLMNCEF